MPLPAGENNIGSVNIAAIVPGTSATSLGKAEDAAHVSGDVGIFALSVRKDTPVATSGTETDYQAFITDASGRLWVNAQASATTSGGWTPYKLISAASTNATVVKASAGQIGYISVSSVNAAARYLKLYNKATSPTVGTDVPVHTFIIPGSTAGAGNQLTIPLGIEFTTGISFALTTEITDAGSTGVAASEITVNIGYK